MTGPETGPQTGPLTGPETGPDTRPDTRPESHPELHVYSRRGCHLCELLIEELVPLCRGRAGIRLREVDDRPEWRAAYGDRVPVLCHGDREICSLHLDAGAVLALLDQLGTTPATPEP